jgi:hypothetical protein
MTKWTEYSQQPARNEEKMRLLKIFSSVVGNAVVARLGSSNVRQKRNAEIFS